MRIEILCTGDEILTGKTINTNDSHMAQRLGEAGLEVVHGTTVGDDRASLLAAFRQAATRADAIIVNGGLGPTVDDLSQEVAAEAAGVPLVLHEPWLARMEAFYERRGRVMPANNRKQAMLPEGAEFIDNPIGTACGFAVTIDGARFYFTPGVPREMRRMLEEQVMPRLLASAGLPGVARLKRFHSFGIGEIRADEMLAGIEAWRRPARQAGLPGALSRTGDQARGTRRRRRRARPHPGAAGGGSAPAPRQLHPRGGPGLARNWWFWMRCAAAAARWRWRESFTGGSIASRLLQVDGAETLFLRGVVSRDPRQLAASVGLAPDAAAAPAMAEALRVASGASHALAVLVTMDGDGADAGGSISIGLADPAGSLLREARLVGGREWVRLGAAELGLDCLRRHLAGLPVG